MKLLALSHTIFISCVYRPNKGEGNQHQHLKWAAGWDPASWSGAGSSASPFSGLLGSPVPGIFNLSDYVDQPSTQQATGQRSTPSAAAGCAEQLHDAGHQHTDSVRDDVTEGT